MKKLDEQKKIMLLIEVLNAISEFFYFNLNRISRIILSSF